MDTETIVRELDELGFWNPSVGFPVDIATCDTETKLGALLAVVDHFETLITEKTYVGKRLEAASAYPAYYLRPIVAHARRQIPALARKVGFRSARAYEELLTRLQEALSAKLPLFIPEIPGRWTTERAFWVVRQHLIEARRAFSFRHPEEIVEENSVTTAANECTDPHESEAAK